MRNILHRFMPLLIAAILVVSGLFTGIDAKAASRSGSFDGIVPFDGNAQNVTYTGKSIEYFSPFGWGEEWMPEYGKDYSIRWSNNVNVGRASYTIYGINGNTGSTTCYFNIVQADISKGSAATTQKGYTYTGKALKPGVKVVVNGRTLKSGTDYTLSYKNNVNIGTATITVKGKGNYKGTKTTTFKVYKPTVKESVPLKIDKKRSNAKGKYYCRKINGATQYEYMISYTPNYKKGTYLYLKRNTNAFWLTSSKLNNQKFLYMKVRASKKVNGKWYYSKWSASRKFGIKL